MAGSFTGRFPRSWSGRHLLCGRPTIQALQNATCGLAAPVQPLPVCVVLRQRHCPSTRPAGVCVCDHNKALDWGDAQSGMSNIGRPAAELEQTGRTICGGLSVPLPSCHSTAALWKRPAGKQADELPPSASSLPLPRLERLASEALLVPAAVVPCTWPGLKHRGSRAAGCWCPHVWAGPVHVHAQHSPVCASQLANRRAMGMHLLRARPCSSRECRDFLYSSVDDCS